MEAPEIFRGMKKVKEYPYHVLYEDKYGKKQSFTYSELGINTYQLNGRNLANGFKLII